MQRAKKENGGKERGADEINEKSERHEENKDRMGLKERRLEERGEEMTPF